MRRLMRRQDKHARARDAFLRGIYAQTVEIVNDASECAVFAVLHSGERVNLGYRKGAAARARLVEIVERERAALVD